MANRLYFFMCESANEGAAYFFRPPLSIKANDFSEENFEILARIVSCYGN
jgi:hypothetical protein